MVIEKKHISDAELLSALSERFGSLSGKKILIIPPDFTRMYSGAGKITAFLLRLLGGKNSIDIMPALGTHRPMSPEECESFFLGEAEHERLIIHRFREDVVNIGTVPADFVSEVSEGLCDFDIPVSVNRRLVSGEYDELISVGQVVPHEVVGMANYSKNIFVGCGGAEMINSSHMLGAFYGLERIMGRDFSPVRRVFDYAEEKFLSGLPLTYILTVTESSGDETMLCGLYIGRSRELFEAAVKNSQATNMIHLDRPIKKAVVYLDPREFKSTWLGNKAVYRTRMAIADGGELIVIAPGIERFGEDDENDRLIRKFGYVGRERVLDLSRTEPELKANLSVAAHLIHGSSDGRFSVTYCTEQVSEKEIRAVGYDFIPYREIIEKYDPSTLSEGINTVDGEEIYYISNPALGLWVADGR